MINDLGDPDSSNTFIKNWCNTERPIIFKSRHFELTTVANDRRGVCPLPNSRRVCCCPATEAALLRGGGRGTSPPVVIAAADEDDEGMGRAAAATKPLERADIIVDVIF